MNLWSCWCDQGGCGCAVDFGASDTFRQCSYSRRNVICPAGRIDLHSSLPRIQNKRSWHRLCKTRHELSDDRPTSPQHAATGSEPPLSSQADLDFVLNALRCAKHRNVDC